MIKRSPAFNSSTLDGYDVELNKAQTTPTTFKADSALLRELGERLVGKPYIALAELVKNAYDADASRCIITLANGSITVSDNGHGMTEAEYLNYWMTIGTRNKQRNGVSRKLRRRVTGSKGVGRLSAQFLAQKLQVLSDSKNSPKRLHAFVDWDAAIEKGSLTEAEAQYRLENGDVSIYPEGSKNGTTVILEGLKQDWDEDEIEELGRQIWMLNSPVYMFGKSRRTKRSPDDFRISFKTDLPGVDEAFETQLSQALENYQAIITGKIMQEAGKGVSLVSVKFGDDEYSQTFSCADFLHEADWEIRVFDLSGRQAGGISVHDMRDYFERYGGVMVYDSGFRLPYYGAENDWLALEYDHSHRRNKSKLLPDHLHVKRALNDLPTQGRIFGVVNVNTSKEASRAGSRKRSGEFLKIQVSRDRLVGNKAFAALRDSVRQSIDYYATLKRRRVASELDIIRPSERPESKIRRLIQLVSELRKTYADDETIQALEEEIKDVEQSLHRVDASDEGSRILLGPLATAGMAALAIEHETKKDMRGVKAKINSLQRLATTLESPELGQTATELRDWIERLEATRRIFLPMLDADDRRTAEPLLSAPVIKSVVSNLLPLMGGVTVTFDLDKDLYFPAAAYSEWNAIFQNVLLNAVNATLDVPNPKIEISSEIHKKYGLVYVRDNGCGIDADFSDKMFKPFERTSNVSDERRELGLGGTGLGLTIVEMIASNRDCEVEFVEPDSDWSTAFELSWRVE